MDKGCDDLAEAFTLCKSQLLYVEIDLSWNMISEESLGNLVTILTKLESLIKLNLIIMNQFQWRGISEKFFKGL